MSKTSLLGATSVRLSGNKIVEFRLTGISYFKTFKSIFLQNNLSSLVPLDSTQSHIFEP